MEAQAVRRRINMLAAHFVPTDEISATNLLPMNCSSTLNSLIRRCDNKVYFARQGSASQAGFMRQASNEDVQETGDQSPSTILNSMIRRCDNKMFFARQGSAYQGCFMRQSSNEEASFAQPDVSPKYSGSENEGLSNASQEGPLFARSSTTKPSFQTKGAMQPACQSCELSAPEPAKFSRPVIEWSPRMDVAESGRHYVMTVEIPGVSINDIKVEVDNQKLTVMGRRSIKYWKVADTSSNDSISAYHRREILQGPYEVVWPLPANVNKDSVSAEFLDGLLRITIPKH
ncbi:hypothetical protein UlMin_020471 [Ulmus minor]